MSYKVKYRRSQVAKLMAKGVSISDMAKRFNISMASIRGDIREINNSLEVAKNVTAGKDSKSDILNVYNLESGDFISSEQVLICLALGYTLITPKGFRYKKIYDKICYNNNVSDDLYIPTSLFGLSNFRVLALPKSS